MPQYRYAFLLLVLATLLSACQTVPEHPLPKLAVQKIIALPVTALHKELGNSFQRVDTRVYEQIQAEGFEVVKPDAALMQAAIDQALEVSGAVYNPGVGRFLPLNKNAFYKALAAQLSQKYAFQLLLVPELMIRNAEVLDGSARWDNVERALVLEDYAVGLPVPIRSKGLSLRVTSYNHLGQPFTDGFWGISLPYAISYRAGEPVFQLKSEFFTSAELKQAVSASFTALNRRIK